MRRALTVFGVGASILFGLALSRNLYAQSNDAAVPKDQTAPGKGLPPAAAAAVAPAPTPAPPTQGLPDTEKARLANPTGTPVSSGSKFDASNRTVPQANSESPLAAVASDPDGLSLLDCYRLAAIRSDTLQIDAQSIRAAQARLSEALAQIFPTVDLVNTENFQKSASSAGSFTVFGGTVTSSGGKLYSNSTRLTLTQTLFNGFANYNNIAAERADVASQRYSLQFAYQTLYQNVAQNFYQILTSQADLVVLADSLRALQGQVDLLEQWVRIGRSRPSALLQAKAQLSGVRVNIEQTKGMLAASKELMAFYLGRPADQIKLRDVQKFPTANHLESYLRTVGARPDVLAQVEQERMASRQVLVAEGALLPSVTANGSYNLTTYPQQAQEWQASLEISLPLFDGGLLINRVKEQRALAAQSALNLENLRRTNDQNLRTAFDNFNSSAAQVVALQEQVELSALNYNAQADDYKSGIVTNLDVLTALSTLQQARLQLSNADVNARLNLVLLHVAAGTVPLAMRGSQLIPGPATSPVPVSPPAP